MIGAEKLKRKMHKKIKKIIPLFLILIILVGIFSPMAKVHAETTAPTDSAPAGAATFGPAATSTPTTAPAAPASTIGSACTTNTGQAGSIVIDMGSPICQPTATTNNNQSELEKNLKSCTNLVTGDFDGCLIKFVYFFASTIPAFLLGIAANFFNFIINLSLSSNLIAGSSFIPNAWGIVRDLSNIFFILILLFLAIQIILGMGGSEVKKTIGKVVIMALLINFSMFFTKIIIDSSNILALVFYNKIDTKTTITNSTGSKVDTYIPISDPNKTGSIEKNISGGLAKAFNPGAMLTADFFKKAKEQTQVISSKLGFATYMGTGALAGSFIPVLGTAVGAGVGAAAYGVKTLIAYAFPTKEIPTPLILGIILVSGAIMIFATYAFFIAGISFLGRLIELWILIIFSPFAFMSFSAPFLKGIDYLSFDDWFKRLLKTSFMAPIFMFFMYFIFLLVNANIFNDFLDRTATQDQGTIETIILIILPAALILILLMKATSYAKKGSGAIGEALLKGAKIAGGIALGATVGGAAALGTRAIGGGGGAAANWLAKKAEKGGHLRTAEKLKDFGVFAQKSSFDLRALPGAGKAIQMAGLTTGAAIGATAVRSGKVATGGWTEMKKQQVEKSQKRAAELEKRGTVKERRELEEAQADLNEATIPVKLELEKADNAIKKIRDDLSEAVKTGNMKAKEEAEGNIIKARETKLEIEGKLKPLKDEVFKKQKELNIKSGDVVKAYAEKITSKKNKIFNIITKSGGYSTAVADEASRKIRAGVKADSGEKLK